MAHAVIPPPRCTAATLKLTHTGNINDKTIPERDREVRDFNITLLASAIARRRHLVIDTHRTNLGVTRQGCHYIHEMIVTANRTCVLFASENIIIQRNVGRTMPKIRRGTPCTILHPQAWYTPFSKTLTAKWSWYRRCCGYCLPLLVFPEQQFGERASNIVVEVPAQVQLQKDKE